MELYINKLESFKYRLYWESETTRELPWFKFWIWEFLLKCVPNSGLSKSSKCKQALLVVNLSVQHLGLVILLKSVLMPQEYFDVTADQCRHGNAIKRAQQCSEALFFIFQTEYLVVSCPFSCVKKAPQAFTFSSLTGTARATSQGHGEEYRELAVGQCPRNCIHYVTPSQRIILEELLGSIMSTPYDTSAEADLLYSLIVKAHFENNRYQKPKKQPKASTKHVDWF
ncbi:hypothetical protein RND71_000810 [Anisodus tanguticus]|uniref:Uncharacterized protein n=1 Tax=Anisodus tanguticus TaxID=243964 RepID=A0AAE1T098_9SOLA|nr:hypothetical protein RND71_000810 [Anisodus tanguticus]